ncbi:MAG TPA: hypothetical protein VMV47_03010 [Bacteroidales bacterium]|nr:hypothetical protein [Bacteroidales bacterium]
MNTKSLKLIISIILILIVSCDEPETVVTNIIHPDGSVTRKIEMRKKDNKFKITDIQVPLDSTWAIADSCEISLKGDTTWIKRAVKDFKNVEELNLAYKTDSGCNSNLKRNASFSKRFRWFNTIYRFSETILNRFKYGSPVSEFLTKDELQWFYSPSGDNEARLNGPDSLRYKSLSDTIDKKKDEWFFRTIVSEWVGEFSEQLGPNTERDMCPDSLKKKENILLDIIKAHGDDIDSLWNSGYILNEFIGESNSLKYRAEADSAMDIVEDRILLRFVGYSVRILMPGKLISSNGFADSSQLLVWPVNDEYFLTEPYEMWAESKVPNIWAWIVSAIFIVFVATGIIVRKKKRD